MNTSSKYANLPFIAAGERDVFESDDLPEADQGGSSSHHHQQLPVHDASIEIIPTGTGDAFQKFSSYDLVGQQSIRSGTDSKESYVAKFNRIKAEIEELKSGLTAGAEEGSNTCEDVALDAADLASKLANLQEIRFSGQSATTATPTSLAKPAASEVESSGGPLIKYELFSKPDKEAVLELSKINFLEQRLKKIESIIGLNETPKDAAFMNSLLKDQSVMAIVIQLSNKVVQLDHASLERVDARLHTILEKLNAISNKKDALEELNRADKLNELYNYYVLTADRRKTLPNVLERLQVLSEVQEQACHFSSTLESMRDMQTEIKQSLEKTGQSLTSLKEQLESKSAAVGAVIADFSERLEKLKK